MSDECAVCLLFSPQKSYFAVYSNKHESERLFIGTTNICMIIKTLVKAFKCWSKPSVYCVCHYQTAHRTTLRWSRATLSSVSGVSQSLFLFLSFSLSMSCLLACRFIGSCLNGHTIKTGTIPGLEKFKVFVLLLCDASVLNTSTDLLGRPSHTVSMRECQTGKLQWKCRLSVITTNKWKQ